MAVFPEIQTANGFQYHGDISTLTDSEIVWCRYEIWMSYHFLEW